MKFRVLATALVLLMTAAVYGQPRFDVPFTFRVGDRSLAAGTYSVTTEGTMGVLLIRSAAGKSITVLPQCGVQAARATAAGKLYLPVTGTPTFCRRPGVAGPTWEANSGSPWPSVNSRRLVHQRGVRIRVGDLT